MNTSGLELSKEEIVQILSGLSFVPSERKQGAYDAYMKLWNYGISLFDGDANKLYDAIKAVEK